jgi:hypothetical protein
MLSPTPTPPVTPSSPFQGEGSFTESGRFVFDNLRDRLMGRDWEFPPYNSEQGAQASGVFSPDEPPPSGNLMYASTYTEPRDFAILNKVNRGIYSPSLSDCILAVVECQPRIIVAKDGSDTESLSPTRPLTYSLDKGCSTEDLPQVDVARAFQCLRDMFPTVPEDDLRHIFDNCGGDPEWASNILIDAGGENLDLGLIKKKSSQQTRLPSSQQLEIKSKADTRQARRSDSEAELLKVIKSRSRKNSRNDEIVEPKTSADFVRGALSSTESKLTPVQPLAMLCHQAIKQVDKPFPTKAVQSAFLTGNMRRLRAVQTFRTRRCLSIESSMEALSLERAQRHDVSVGPRKANLENNVFFRRSYSLPAGADLTHKTETVLYVPENEDVVIEEETEILEQNGKTERITRQYSREKLPEMASEALPSAEASQPELEQKPKEVKPPPANDGLKQFDDLTLTLPPDLARHLMKMFGPVGFHVSPGTV